MPKLFLVAQILNAFLLLILLVAIVGFLSFQNAYGFFLASVTAIIAYGTFKNTSMGYFAAAAWGLACYQLAKEGYEFQAVKHQVMTLGFIVVPLALFLHEILAKRKNKNAHKSVTKTQNDENMPL